MSHSETYAEIDRSAYTNALVKCSPITKAFFALSALIICVSVSTVIVPVVVFVVCTILVLGIARVRAKLYFNLFVYPTYMLALSCIFLALFFGSGASLIDIQLPWFTWSIFKSGISMSITTFLRVEGALSCIFFLVLTTSITDLCVLLRRVHMPQIMVELSMMIYRYIFLFLEISEQMSLAQKLRLRRSGWLNRIRALSMLIGSLFIRTLDQGERTLAAMNARGYDGDIRILEDFAPPKKLALLGIVIFDVLLVLLLVLTLNIGVI